MSVGTQQDAFRLTRYYKQTVNTMSVGTRFQLEVERLRNQMRKELIKHVLTKPKEIYLQ